MVHVKWQVHKSSPAFRRIGGQVGALQFHVPLDATQVQDGFRSIFLC